MKPASHCLKLTLKAQEEDKKEIWEATLAGAHKVSVDAIMNWFFALKEEQNQKKMALNY